MNGFPGVYFDGTTADWTGAGVRIDTSYQCRFVNCEANENWFGFNVGNGFSTFWTYGELGTDPVLVNWGQTPF